MVRKAVYLTLIVILVAVIAPVQVGARETYTLGLSLPATTGVFFEGVSKGAQLAAEEAGAELVVLASEYDLEVELANMQALIDQGVDAVLFSPTDPVQSVEAVALANAADVPVFVLGDLTLAEDAQVELAGQFVSDNAAMGALAGEAVCSSLENAGTVLEVVNLEEDVESVMAERSTGFETYMAENCADVTVTPVNVFDLSFDDGLDAILNALDAGEFNTLVALDDATTLQAVSARDIVRRADMVLVAVGTHPDLSSSLLQEKLTAIVLAEPWPLGQSSVETTLAYLNGDDIAELTVDAVLTILNAQNLEIKRCPLGVPPSRC